MANEILCPSCNALNPEGADFCAKCGIKIDSSTNEDPLIGAFVGERFKVIEKLGEGGMGVVYKAEQTAMDRMVALKVLHPHITDETMYARFRNEAAASSRLSHPNTITVYDFGKTNNGSLYIAMELIRGISMDDEIIEHGPMDWQRVCNIGKQICGSLQDAHDNNILHRDLKPENVMLCTRGGKSDVVKVLDFGIAKLMGDDGQDQRKALTKTGMVFGTPQYMSPEQIRGEKKIDSRSDIYSTGIILYQALTGNLPFKSETPMGVLTMHLLDKPPAFKEIAPDQNISQNLETIVMATLSKDKEQRPKSMEELANMLDNAAAGTSSERSTLVTSQATPATSAVTETDMSSSVSKNRTTPIEPFNQQDKKNKAGLIGILIVLSIILLGSGAAGWYFIAGPGKTSSIKTTAYLPKVKPPVNSTIPTPILPQPVQQTGVIPASQAPLASLPAIPVVDTISKEKTNTKLSRTKKTKNIKIPKSDEIPSDIKLPENVKLPKDVKLPNEITIPKDVRFPNKKDVSCSISKNNDKIGSALGKKLRQGQKLVKMCSVKNMTAITKFTFTVPKNSNKIGNIRIVNGSVSHMNHCLLGVLRNINLGTKDAAPRKGRVDFTIKRADGAVSQCKIKVTASKN